MKHIIDNAKKFYFIGIGGIGMSSIAQYMHAKGKIITGSDLNLNSSVKQLMALGLKINISHSIQNITDDIDVVVTSSAIRDNNIELIYAQKKNIPVIKRYQLLSHIINEKKSIAIAGSHGKTTTTSLCASLFKEAGLDPTAIMGGKLRNINNNVMIGESEYFIAEADESDGGFLLLNPHIGVVTNIDNDHLGFYGNFENEKIAFRDFIESSSVKILNFDDPIIKQIKNDYKNCITYSITSKKADIYAYNITVKDMKSFFDVKIGDRILENIEIGVIGLHNVSNALAVCAIAQESGIKESVLRKAFAEFKGVDRRFTYLGKYNNLDVYDDYAHHPNEIKATISSAKLISNKVYAIFQPHRFSRTSYLMDDFSKSFKNIDKVFVLDVYSASEEPIDGINSLALSEKINKVSGNAVYINNYESLKKHLDQIENKGVLTALGAGSISQIAKKLVNDN